MKQIIILTTSICLCLLVFVQAKAQNNNPCSQYPSWGEWREFSGGCPTPPCGASIRFKKGVCSNSGNVCREGLQWEYHNNVVIKDAYYKIIIQYKTCSGKGGQMELKMDLEHTGTWQPSGSYTSDGGTELTNMTYQLVNPKKDKAKSLTAEVNTTRTNYYKQYNDAIAAANKVKNSVKHNELIQQINANHDLFGQYLQQAQSELNSGNGDAMAQTLDKMKQQQNSLHTIYLRIDPDEPIVENNKPTSGTSKTVIKNTVPTTTKVDDTQNKQYETQSDNYLNDARNSKDAIEQARNYNDAKIAALRAGDKAKADAIQKEQDKAQQQSFSKQQNEIADNLSNTLAKADERKDAARKQAAQAAVKQYNEKINNGNSFLAKTHIVEDDIDTNNCSVALFALNKMFVYTVYNGKIYLKKNDDKKWGEYNTLNNEKIATYLYVEEKKDYILLYDENRKLFLKFTDNECFWGYTKETTNTKQYTGKWIDLQQQHTINK